MRTAVQFLIVFLAGCAAFGGAMMLLAYQGWWFVAGGVLMGVGLYVIRDAERILYAAAELLFALFLLWKASTAGKGDFGDDFGAEFTHNDLSVTVLQSMGQFTC